MKTVIIGLLGTVLDRGRRTDRWSKWRPTVSLCQHDDLLVDRYELITQGKYSSLTREIADDIRSVSPETEVNLHDVALVDPWNFEDVYETLLDFFRNYPFDPENENYLVHITTGTHVAQICLFLLTEARYIPGKLIQSAPPKRKQPSSQGLYDIIDLDLSRYDRIASRVRQVAQDDVAYLKSGIQTQNAAFNILIGEIEHVAMRSVEPILLIGPTGAGKSQLARRIHELKRSRSQLAGRFVEVNCATLRGDAALSTLFGHRKGAFTGAASDRGGLLREADGGMLFLDEIGELGLDEQAMLLRAIEEKRFYPMGADTEVASDFQLVCGTNRDLRSAISTGTFREDLLERINLWTFTYPGLRERREDIEPNLDYELDRFADANNRRVRFSHEARERYLSFAISPRAHWHANFRDLNSSIIRMATLAPGGRITRDVVSRELARLNEKWGVKARSLDSPVVQILGQQAAEQLDRFDYAQLDEVLKVCLESHSLSEAGRSLFAISRTQRKKTNDADRLRKYLARFGLSWQTLKGRE